MSWIKEEYTKKEDIKEHIEWLLDEFEYDLPWGSININNVINEIQESQKSDQMNNPVLSYTWYLFFERLVINNCTDFWITTKNIRIPLWIVKHGSQKFKRNMQILGRYTSGKYYQEYLRDSYILNNYGELGELEYFIHKIMDTWISDDEELKKGIRDVIINPEWRDELNKLPSKEQQKWNAMYEPEDWMNHAVF